MNSAVTLPIGPPNGADECTIEYTSTSQIASGPPDPPDQQDHEADRGQRDERVLDRIVVEVAGVLDDGVEQRLLLALVGVELVPGDDLGLLQHADELRQQQQHRRRGDRDAG